MVGYTRRKLRREQLEATVRPQPANGAYNTATGQPKQRANDAVTNYEHNYRTPAIQRAAGHREMLMREAFGEMTNDQMANSEISNSRASQIDRSAERQQRVGQQRNFNYLNGRPESGSKETFVIVNRGDLTYGDRFRRVKKEKPVELSRMASRTNGGRPADGLWSQSLRLADPVPRFATSLMNLQEEDVRRPQRLDSMHDLDGSREIPLTQQELESSSELIKKEYLSYWTRINMVKLYSEITNIKRRIGMPRIYTNRIQP